MIFLIVFIIMLNVTYLDSKIFIYYPFQNSYVKYKNVEIIGESDDFINYINVVNAKVIKSKVISKKYFYIKVSLKSKKNKIRLIFNKKSNAVLNINLSNQQNFFIHRFINITDCFSCHEKDLKKIKIVKGNCTTGICHQNILKHKHIHGPVGIKNCIACHTPHGSRSPKLLIKTGANLCYFCHKDKKQEFAKNFEHKPVRNGECIKCHDPHGSSFKYQLKVSCFSCHKKKKFTGKKFVHGPVAVGKCLSCHNPHASNKRFLLKKTDFKILCFKCHNRKRFLSGKNVHGPVGGGLCYKCHDPHCSNNQKLLKKTLLQGELCFECHNRFKIIDSKYVHGPVGAGMCLSCHKIHSSNFNYLLIESKERGKLCFKCHKDKKVEFSKRYIHKPVKKDCTECHDAHSSPYKYQLIGDCKIDVCLKCHKKISKLINSAGEKIHPIIPEKGCKACHNPHASNFKYQLFAKINDLCKSCHVWYKRIKTRGHPVERHPVTGRRNPLNRRKRFNCASCHNPHASKYNYLLIGSMKNFEVCKKCHNY